MASAESAAEAAALADATLLRVLARMASPLRHDLAGALLVPQMQLQMLRRKLGRPGADPVHAIAAIDDVLLRLQDLRAVQLAAVSWLSGHDDRRLALEDAVAKAAADFALPFSARGSEVVCTMVATGKCYAAQPLLLLVHAAFCAVLDDEASASARIEVECSATDDGVAVQWRATPATTDLVPESPESTEATPVHLVLSVAGVAALCARWGARFSAEGTNWRLLPGAANEAE